TTELPLRGPEMGPRWFMHVAPTARPAQSIRPEEIVPCVAQQRRRTDRRSRPALWQTLGAVDTGPQEPVAQPVRRFGPVEVSEQLVLGDVSDDTNVRAFGAG